MPRSPRPAPFGLFGTVRTLPHPVRVGLRLAPVWIIAGQTFGSAGSLHGGAQWGLAVGLLVVVAGAWSWILFGTCSGGSDQLALVLAIGAGAGLHVLTGAGQVFVVGYAAAYVGPFFYGLPVAVPSWLAAVTAVGLATALVGRYDPLGGLGNALGAFFFGMAALSWGRVMRTGERNAELVEQLRASRDEAARNAAAAERARLARELHDVLAHTLSGLALHLESTRALARRLDVPPDIEGRIGEAVTLARAGLDEARAAVRALRDEQLPGPERLPDLLARFTATTGIDCRYAEHGTPQPLPIEARVALFRAAQEALSNVAKHAGRPDRVEVALTWDDAGVTLRVADHAVARERVGAPGASGHGLRGMRERAELAGGRLEAGPTDDGFSLEMSLPLR